MDNVETVPVPTMWRPLGFGEIFDRAITLYFRNFWPFVGIALVISIPTAIFAYAIDSFQSGPSSIFGQFQHPGTSATAPAIEALLKSGSVGGIALAAIVIGLLIVMAFTLATVASAVGVARRYAGKPVEFRACYRAVLPSWGKLVGVILMMVLIAIATVIALLIAIIVPLRIVSLMQQLILTFVVAAVLYLAAIGIAFALNVVGMFAMYSVVIENAGVMEAIGSGFARVFSRKYFWRAIGLIVCSTLLQFVVGLIIAFAAQVALYFNLVWVSAVLNALLQTFVLPFAAILLAVFYYDIRIRSEGLDLAEGLDRLSSGDRAPA